MDEYCKVLIVDDEFIMRQGMKHMLEWEQQGFLIVGEASNGQEGLALVDALRPHIVLADIVMPIIDGIEFSEIMGKRYPLVQLIILSSYDKFEYVKTTLLNGAADYILKPTLSPGTLLNTLHKAVERIPGMQLKSQIEVPYTSQMEKVLLGFKDKLDEMVFAGFFTHTLFRVLAVHLREASGRKKEEMVSMHRTAEQYFNEIKDYVVLPVFLNEGILCVILNYRLKDETKVVLDAEEIASKMARIYPRTFFVLSRSFSNMQEIRQHYQKEVSLVLNQAFYHAHKHLLILEKIAEKKQTNRFEFELYTRLLNQSRFQEALQMFTGYVQYLWEVQTEQEKLKNLTKNLLYNFLLELETLMADCDELKERFFSMLEQALWVENFQQAMKQIEKELAEFLGKNETVEEKRIVEMKQYVASHYQESLDLSHIAERFGLSYHYLSSYFSQMAKEGFSEYLNKLRIERAMDLLQNSDYSIAQVGCTVGYAEHSYFCRVFKKMTGDTPSTFRRRERRRDE